MTSNQPLLLSSSPRTVTSVSPPLNNGSFDCLRNGNGSYISPPIRSLNSSRDESQFLFEMPSFDNTNGPSMPGIRGSGSSPNKNPGQNHNPDAIRVSELYDWETQQGVFSLGDDWQALELEQCANANSTQRHASKSKPESYSSELHGGPPGLSNRGTFEISSTTNIPSPQKTEAARRQADLAKGHHGSKPSRTENSTTGDANERVIHINDPELTNDKYEFTGNEIRTSKYTIITFLPKNLFVQFHRVAYIYFLVIAALNQLPWLAVFGRTVSLFPLLFVLCVTAIKDGYEDWRRHRSDRKENNRLVEVLQGGQFQYKKWKDVRVGEVLMVHATETISCDMVLLGTSDPSGIAYVQTINLDGESNLKTRYARQETASKKPETEPPSGIIRCEQPNRNIYGFVANMEVEVGGRSIPLVPSNILLRGCQLKNTDWAVGVAVYAGQETKAMLNSSGTPSKRSRLEAYMNRETLWLSVFLFIMCAVVAIGMGQWLERHRDQLDTSPYFRKKYFTNGDDNGEKCNYFGVLMEILISFLSSVIVFQIMIPISLYISMELVRLGQSYFMIGDTRMYDSNSNSRFQCRSLNINEDLGQIKYVFSDKTGTLTENKMEFRNASIYGVNYCNGKVTMDSVGQESTGRHEEKESIADTTEVLDRQVWRPKMEVKVDAELVRLLGKSFSTQERKVAHEYFLTMAACNTIVPTIIEGERSIDYQGESPDEQALVSAAAAYGYALIERTSGHIVIDILGVRQRLDVLGLHEFDSVRKRMSVVVRCPDNTVKVLVKGADSSMLNIMSKTPNNNQVTYMEATENHLHEYASQGLRTLVVGAKNLSDEELEEWQHSYQEASTALIDRTALLREAASLIECNLNLLGATGIEDKLQDGVPETIESLREAGVKVWVLTGDKQETAISIGLSCKLLTHNMQQVIINGTSKDACKKLLEEAKATYRISRVETRKSFSKRQKSIDIAQAEGMQETEGIQAFPESMSHVIRQITDINDIPKDHGTVGAAERHPPLALIIDGTSLVYILESDLEQELFDLAISCRVVLCCRVAPLQKAGVVDLIKSRTNDMTLAIGDGANDVSMIQMADVGVGISGQEGRQAVMASDFAMGQFKFLKRLLLVHGHWNYQRVGYLVLYNFYRNAVFVLMLFWYILYTAFSTTSALTDWSSVFYSVIYTSVPTIVVGILDKDLSHKTLLRYPKLYGSGHRQESYNLQLFWLTMADTLWQSLVLFYVPYLSYENSTIDIWSMGSLWTIAVVVLVNVHLSMDIQRWALITHVAVWGSIIVTYACLLVLDSLPGLPNYWTIYQIAKSSSYWLNIILITFLALLPRFLLKVLKQRFWPSDIQIAREAEILRKTPGHLSVKLTETKDLPGH